MKLKTPPLKLTKFPFLTEVGCCLRTEKKHVFQVGSGNESV